MCGEQQLASAVIHQALLDAQRVWPAGTSGWYAAQDARRWFRNAELVQWWLAITDLPVDDTYRRVLVHLGMETTL